MYASKETQFSQWCRGFLGEGEQIILCHDAGLTCREVVEGKPTFKAHSEEKSPLYTLTLLDLKSSTPYELFQK